MFVSNFTRNRNGATAVEFALVLWPFVMLMFGSIEVARLLWTQQALNKTAISAARCVGIRSDSCAKYGVFDRDLATAFIQKQGQGWGVPITLAAITIVQDGDCNGSPGYATVKIATDFFSPMPFIAKLISESQQIEADSCFPAQASGL